MSETLKKLALDDLKEVNGGQIYFAIAEDGPCWCVPWPDVGLVCTYHKEEAAIKRAQKLGLPTEIKYCENPERAQALAELTAWRYNIAPRLDSLSSV